MSITREWFDYPVKYMDKVVGWPALFAGPDDRLVLQSLEELYMTWANFTRAYEEAPSEVLNYLRLQVEGRVMDWEGPIEEELEGLIERAENSPSGHMESVAIWKGLRRKIARRGPPREGLPEFRKKGKN